MKQAEQKFVKKIFAAEANTNFSWRSVLMFLVIGGFATGLHYFLATLCVFVLGLSLIVSSAVGFAISAVANYLLNARITYRSKQSHIATAPRFFLTAGLGLLINSLLLTVFVSYGLHAISAQLLTTLGVLIWNYGINGLWTFKKNAA